jgi:hypothetical protein
VKRPLYPPWTLMLLSFFLFVICLALLAGDQPVLAAIVGILTGYCVGQAAAKWSSRYDYEVEDTCPNCGTQVHVSFRRIADLRATRRIIDK